MCRKEKFLRNKRGASIVEFGAAFSVFVIFFFIPLINLGFIGVRYSLAQGAIQEAVHRLALAEKRSDAYADLASDNWWSNICSQCGVNVSNKTLDLVICSSTTGTKTKIHQGQDIPAVWLPNGANGPCVYALDLTCDVSIPPVFNSGPPIPAVTAPVVVKLSGKSAWENLACDPASKEFYVNE